MASRSKALPALVLAALCMLAFRSLTFAAPSSSMSARTRVGTLAGSSLVSVPDGSALPVQARGGAEEAKQLVEPFGCQAPIMPSVGLLKFPGGTPTLMQDGLEVIRRLAGPIVPVIFIGDGRGGKSYLASTIARTPGLFASQDTAQAVTEGIDVVAIPRVGGGHLLLMDAEGGNNALAGTHKMVNVLAINLATSVVFVASARLSEDSLQTLAQTLAVQALIREDPAARMPQRSLIFVVNMCNLRYDDSDLEKALKFVQQDPGRAEICDQIARAFPAGSRRFLSVPMEGVGGNFQERVQALASAVYESAPMQLGGAALNGNQIAEIVIRSFNGVRDANLVQMPSVTRAIIFDGFLQPTATSLFAEHQARLPALADYDPELSGRNPGDGILISFDAQCAHIGFPDMKAEARSWLSRQMEESWGDLTARNVALGEQARDVTTETREVFERSYEQKVGRGGRRYGIAGPRKAIKVTKSVYRIETRTRTLLKNGTVSYSSWADSGRRSEQ